ncbi:MAG: NAD-dependent epimerase/dehydratase family protein, partial [Xanthomonadales bacterium]|nr:NAD-dependent epimerase/dehydratase family protein [Xanthomonadales bacterium]
MKKVVVTGAAGHIGANLVRELLARGYRVSALVRKSGRALEGLEVERHAGDVRDVDSLCSAFADSEHVYHLAARVTIQPGEWDRLRAVNVEGTRNVLHACCRQGVATLVHFSSVHALEMSPLGSPVTEDNRLLGDDEGSDYDRSKAQSERLVRNNTCSSLSTRIIYPTAVIGPHDYHHSLTGQAIARMARGSLPMLITGGFDWVDVRDVVAGAIAAAETGEDQDRYLLSGHYRSVSEMAKEISAMVGARPPRFSVSPQFAAYFAPLMVAWARLRGETP